MKTGQQPSKDFDQQKIANYKKMEKVSPETSFRFVYDTVVKFMVQRIFKDKIKVISHSLATIFSNDQKTSTRWTKLFGILALEVDLTEPYFFLRLYDLDTFEITFQCELFYGFGKNYREIGPQLQAFDFYGGSICLGFRNKEQAKNMLNAIKSIRTEDFSVHKKAHPFSKQGTKVYDVNTKSTLQIPNFSNNIVFNPKVGHFETQNLSPEVNKVLQSIGVTKEQLENRESAEVIFEEMLMCSAMKQAEQNDELRVIMESTLKRTVSEIQEQVIGDYSHIEQLNTVIDIPKLRKDPVRQQLMQQIQSGNFRLKAVEVQNKQKVIIDLDDKIDFFSMVRKRSRALRRFEKTDE